MLLHRFRGPKSGSCGLEISWSLLKKKWFLIQEMCARSGDPINVSVASKTAVVTCCHSCLVSAERRLQRSWGQTGDLRYWPCQKIHHSLTQVAEKSFTLQFPLAQEFKVFFAKVFVACIVSHQLKFIDQLISNGRKSTLINPYPANCFDCFGLPAVFLRCLLPSQLI